MLDHPFGAIDYEDRRLGRKEGFWAGLVAGLGMSLGVFGGALYWGWL